MDILDLIHYFPAKSDSRAINRLSSGGIDCVGKLMSGTLDTLRNTPNIGATTVRSAVRYRKWLTLNICTVAHDHRRMTRPVYYPRVYDEQQTLLGVLRSTMHEVARELSSRLGHPRYAASTRTQTMLRLCSSILILRYEQGLPFAAIGERLGRTTWHITKTHTDLITDLMEGRPLSGNIYLRSELRRRMKHCVEVGMFRSGDILGDVQPDDTALLSVLGISLVHAAPGIRIVVPAHEKCRFTAKSQALLRTLRETVAPQTPDEIYAALSAREEFATTDTHDRRFIDSLIFNPTIMDHRDDGRLHLRMDHYVSDEQRMARVIYENGGWMTRAQITQAFIRTIGRECNSVNLSNLRKYDIYSSGNQWTYGRKLPALSQYVAEWSRQHPHFTMDELEDALRKEGYPLLRSRIRAYVTMHCLVDNADANHFCHKNHIADHIGHQWRRPGRNGLANWILQRVRDLCEERHPISTEHVVDYVEQQARESDLQPYIRQRVRRIITEYTGTDRPFVINADGLLDINEPIYHEVNFATIGRRGAHQTELHEKVRRHTMEIVGHSPGARITLMELVRALRDIDGLRELDRSRCLRALRNTHLAPLPLSIENISGVIHLIRR